MCVVNGDDLAVYFVLHALETANFLIRAVERDNLLLDWLEFGNLANAVLSAGRVRNRFCKGSIRSVPRADGEQVVGFFLGVDVDFLHAEDIRLFGCNQPALHHEVVVAALDVPCAHRKHVPHKIDGVLDLAADIDADGLAVAGVDGVLGACYAR